MRVALRQQFIRACSSDRTLLLIVLAAAAAIRLGWALVAAPPPESDFLTFFTTGQLIGQGHWWPDAYGWAWQGPGYPLLLAPLTLLGGASLPAIYVMNVLLGVLTVALVWRLGSTLFGARAGIVAAAIAAVFPGLWLWTPIVSAENLSIPIFLGIAVLLVRGPTRWRLPLIGMLAGYLVFVRPSTLLFLFVVLVSVIWLAPSGTRRRSATLFLAGAIAVIGGFAALNLREGGPALPVGASGWQPWLVYNERSTGAWFAAQDRADYPFRGLENNPALAGILRSAQQKLALQFAVLNPGEILPGIVDRHVSNWASDKAGLNWTVERPGASPAASALGPPLDFVVDRYYLAILGLAFLGALRLLDRPGVVVALVLPLAYLTAPAVIAEGNARYHVNGLAFLATLAGGAVSGKSLKAGVLAVGIVLVAFLVPPALLLPPWLVVGILLVGAARLLAEARLKTREWMGVGAFRRRRVLLSLAAGVVAVQLAGAFALLSVRQAVIDWSLTQPDGWTAYRSDGTAEIATEAVTQQPSDVPVRFRKVSFPDAVGLPEAPADPGQHVGLQRTFPDLQPGTSYVVYLQVLDQRPTGAGDHLTVRLNGRVVWEAGPASSPVSDWQDVVVPWTADSGFALVEIERSASTSRMSYDVLIRSMHVYPKY